MRKIMLSLALLTLTAFLAACGGGGGGGESVEAVDTRPPGDNTVVSPSFYSMEEQNGLVLLTFGKGDIGFGLISPVNPADVDCVQWQSNSVGWGKSTVTGYPMVDAGGIWSAEVPGVPYNDPGNFVVKLKSGEVIWFNLGVWLLPARASFNAATGQVSFSAA